MPQSPPDDDPSLRPPLSYLMGAGIQKMAYKGLFEGHLTSREIQELCGAVMAVITAVRSQDTIVKPKK